MLEDMENFFDKKTVEKGDLVVASDKEKTDYNTKNIEYFYKKLEIMGINLDELRGFLECNTDMLGASCAGSGKTTAIVLKLLRGLLGGELMKDVQIDGAIGGTVQVPSNILVCTFLKTGAEELSRVLKEWSNKLGITGLDLTNIKFKTIHAEVYETLKYMGVSISIIDEKENNAILRNLMQVYGIRNVKSKGTQTTFEQVSDVAGILAYARNRIKDGKYDHPLMSEYDLDSIKLDILIEETKKERKILGKMDFEDMQEMLLEGLKSNPNIGRYLGAKYDYIYVDEFQDTSQLQYELFKPYFDGVRQKVVVGDDDQTIYGWRGSDIKIITESFIEDYNPDIKMLTTNYRCKSNILDAVIPSIQRNTNRLPKPLKAFKEGGEVSVIDMVDVEKFRNMILEDIKENRTVGVLGRKNRDLIIPTILLEIDNTIDFEVSKGVTLSSGIPSLILGMTELFTKRYTDKFQKLLIALQNDRYTTRGITKLCTTLKGNRKLTLFTIADEDIKFSCAKLYNVLKTVKDLREKHSDVEAYLYILEYMRGVVYQGDSEYARSVREFTDFVIELIMTHPKVCDLDMRGIDELFHSTLPENLAKRSRNTTKKPIKLTTVHEAKGKEWDSVYIYGNTRNNFPAIIGQRDLTKEEIEEERRVHYIAWTRAKEKLVVLTQKGEEGDFLRECNIGATKSNIGEVLKPKAIEEVCSTETESVTESNGTVIDSNETVEEIVEPKSEVIPTVVTKQKCAKLDVEVTVKDIEDVVDRLMVDNMLLSILVMDCGYEVFIQEVLEEVVDKRDIEEVINSKIAL